MLAIEVWLADMRIQVPLGTACLTYDRQTDRCQMRVMQKQCQKTDFELLLVRKGLGVQPSLNLFIRCENDWHPVMQPAQPKSPSTQDCFWQHKARWHARNGWCVESCVLQFLCMKRGLSRMMTLVCVLSACRLAIGASWKNLWS